MTQAPGGQSYCLHLQSASGRCSGIVERWFSAERKRAARKVLYDGEPGGAVVQLPAMASGRNKAILPLPHAKPPVLGQ